MAPTDGSYLKSRSNMIFKFAFIPSLKLKDNVFSIQFLDWLSSTWGIRGLNSWQKEGVAPINQHKATVINKKKYNTCGKRARLRNYKRDSECIWVEEVHGETIKNTTNLVITVSLAS